MTKITVDADCGNSPKKLFLKELNIAFAQADIETIDRSVTDDISWHIVGDKRIEGKQDFMDALEETKDRQVAELILDTVITHGREGAASGKIRMQDGKSYAFCTVYKFRGAKGERVKSIQSYVIEDTGK